MPTLPRPLPTPASSRRAAPPRRRPAHPSPRRAPELTAERLAALRAQLLAGAWDTPAHAASLAARLFDLGVLGSPG